MSEMDLHDGSDDTGSEDVGAEGAGFDTASLPDDLEAPEADAAEQRSEVGGGERDDPIAPRADSDVDADPADVADQHRVVGLDEDDYR